MRFAILLLLALLSAQPSRADVVPLDAAELAILEAIPEDPPPRKLDATREDLEGRHYLSGDELNLHLFYPDLKDLGGVYLGVGTDQAYLFTGWMRPVLAFVTDYDPVVKHLHRAYAVFFAEAGDIETFISFWQKKNHGTSEALLKERIPGREGQEVLRAFRSGRFRVNKRLRQLRRWMAKAGVPSFVTDEEMYRYVRSMVVEGRLRPMQINLLDTGGLVGIAAAMRELDLTVRAIYPSNAEQYWDYTDRFRDNIRAQPFDERSIIVRTVATKNRNRDYHYNVQTAQGFLEWFAPPPARNVRRIVALRHSKGKIPYTHLGGRPSDQQPGATDGTPLVGDADTCTYRSYAFDVKTGRPAAKKSVKKSRAKLTDEERDPVDPRCTVCSEDQVEVSVPGLPAVRVCRHYAAQVRQALETIAADGSFAIETLEGYRPGRTRGPVRDGRRTVFSNHSYGTAIDINARYNGLYGDCPGRKTSEADLKGCRKAIGGAWRPTADPRHSIAAGGVVHRAFTAFWKWGGELPGKLKDFMHFSLTGE